MKLTRSFYKRPALDVVTEFLGKYLVHNTPQGKLSGLITDVEAYPAFVDKVSHGNKRTKRTEVLYGQGGFAYVYLIYGMHHQFAAVVNKTDVPEVVFIRAVYPEEGVELMKKNFGKETKKVADLTRSPGNLCKSFGITLKHYGTDLTGDLLYIEDRGICVSSDVIKSIERVGISNSLEGSKREYRYYYRP